MLERRRHHRLLSLSALSACVCVAACGASSAAVRPPPEPGSSVAPAVDSPQSAGLFSAEAGLSFPGPMEEVAPEDRMRRVTIAGSGDVMAHLKVIRSAHFFEPEGGFEHVFAPMAQVIRDQDIAFANLETPLSMRLEPRTGSPPILGAPTSVAQALASIGIDVLSAANNHAYDQGAQGLSETLSAVEGAHVRSVGAHATRSGAAGPIVIERNGLRIAFVAFTEAINRGPMMGSPSAFIARYNREDAIEALAQARQVADLVVLSIHWSYDFVHSPFPRQRETARIMVEAGADLILGHGPHVLQEVERLPSPRGEAVCAYSLGNFVSNQGLRYYAGRRRFVGMHPATYLPTTRDSVWLRVPMSVDEEGRVAVGEMEGIPLWTHNNFLDFANRRSERLDIHVHPLYLAPEQAIIDERMPIIAAALGSEVRLIEAPESPETTERPAFTLSLAVSPAQVAVQKLSKVNIPTGAQF